MRSAKWGVLVVFAAWGMMAGAQQGASQSGQTSQQASTQSQEQKSQDQLAEAARRAREKRTQQPKATKVFDNDNLPTTPNSISVVGEAKAESEAAAPVKTQAPAAEGTAAPKAASGETVGTDEQKAELEKQLAEAKEQLQTAMTDLDIASRKLALDQQTYYGKPNFSTDEEGAAALKVEEGVVESKKQEVADAQKKVDELTAKLKELENAPAKE